MKLSELKIRNFPAFLRKNAPLFLVVGVGLLLLLWPGKRSGQEQTADTAAYTERFSVSAQEKRLETILSRMDGAGTVSVLLSVSGSEARVYASDVQEESSSGDSGAQSRRASEYVTVRGSGSTESPVMLETRYPSFTGAVVAAQGADSASVRLALTQAVSAATGLGAGQIVIVKMK